MSCNVAQDQLTMTSTVSYKFKTVPSSFITGTALMFLRANIVMISITGVDMNAVATLDP